MDARPLQRLHAGGISVREQNADWTSVPELKRDREKIRLARLRHISGRFKMMKPVFDLFIYNSDLQREFEEMRGFLLDLMDALGVKSSKRGAGVRQGDATKLPKWLRDIAKQLASRADVQRWARVFQAELDAMTEPSDDDDVLLLPSLMVDDQIVMQWDNGIPEFQTLSLDELWAQLGRTTLPFFNTTVDPEGVVTPWEAQAWAALSPAPVPFAPRWHQLAGILKILNNIITRQPTLNMDAVGLGKTLQAVGAIAVYAWLVDLTMTIPEQGGEGQLPGMFANCKSIFVRQRARALMGCSQRPSGG
ncbi:hypothetical protein EWM64_g7578 [Hericium alpestre]|uniref:SNF2 N-terminal domain-containing protein n=1 Tax=Hericium alpestre TaxID=135208 RepID=A0A4Y9ZQ96_9AGAM|nr:hypothetical protein EWM64_g7578 [Hericium alpestre]